MANTDDMEVTFMRRLSILATFILLFFIAYDAQSASTNQTASVATANEGKLPMVNGEKTIAGIRPTRQGIEHMAEAQFHDFDSRLKALQKDVEKTRRKARGELNEAAEDIKRELTGAKQRLEKFSDASGEAWKSLKIKLSDKIDHLKHAYDRAIAELTKPI